MPDQAPSSGSAERQCQPELRREACPPPEGWTLAEAAMALFPDLYAAAAQPAPKGWRKRAGVEPHSAEREKLRTAFARLMQVGEYRADGMMGFDPSLSRIKPHVWRVASFELGLPDERKLANEVEVVLSGWYAVRVKKSRSGASAEKRRRLPTALESPQQAAANALGPERLSTTKIVSTGAPGRPTSMHLIQGEHRRRLDTGEAFSGLADESRCLEAWLRETHPGAPQPKSKSISNKIAAAHRSHKTRTTK
jgi:hypothetical protein